MLILTRKIDQSIIIENDITIVVLGVERDRVKLGIQAPAEVAVLREELYTAEAAETPSPLRRRPAKNQLSQPPTGTWRSSRRKRASKAPTKSDAERPVKTAALLFAPTRLMILVERDAKFCRVGALRSSVSRHYCKTRSQFLSAFSELGAAGCWPAED